jgi:Chaperone of endosialidase
MAISLKHSFQSAKTDGPDNTIVQPSDWNDEHVLTQASGKLLGRTSAGAGATEEISAGSGLSLSAGTLAADVTSVAGRTGAVTLGISDVANLQTSLDDKAPLASPTFTGTVTLPSGTSVGSVTSTELSYLSGVTSSIQTQISAKLSTSATTYVQQDGTSGSAYLPSGSTAQRPASPSAGYIRYNTTTGKFEGYGSAWGNIGGGAAIGDTPPANPGAGDLWWNSADGRMYVYYTDANSSQWVDLSAGGAGQYLPLTGGTVSGNFEYTGTLAGGTGVINIGSGQIYKDASGNVGIGTNTPVTKLDVAGSTRLFSESSTQDINALFVSSTAGPQYQFYKYGGSIASPTIVSSGDATGRIQFFGYDGASLQPTAEIRSVVDGTPGAGDMPGRLVFYTTPDNSTTLTERLRIDANGNLAVGTTSSVAFINADSSQNKSKIYVGGFGQGQGYGISFRNGVNSSAVPCFFANAAGTSIGSIGTSSGTSTSYNTTSDYRLKENVQPMQNALEKVAALNPVTYTWKEDGSDGQGFIAHELQAVVPDCVTGEKDAVDADGNPIYQGVDTSFLVATLTKAIQELNEKVDALQSELATLKGGE